MVHVLNSTIGDLRFSKGYGPTRSIIECSPFPLCALFFNLLNRINLPPVSPHFGFVSADPLDGDRLSNLRHIAWKLGYALRNDAVRSVHAFHSRAFTDANVGVAVVSFCDLR